MPPAQHHALPNDSLSTRAKGSVAPDLSIVIVNWNTRELLAACLCSIADCRLPIADCSAPNNLNHQSTNLPTTEVFIIDNASSDGSAGMVRERFPWARLIENAENLGFARANNQGIAAAGGRYVLLLNSDTEVRPGALRALVDLLEAHPEAGASGPKMLNPDGSLQNSYGSLPTVLDELLGPYWADFFTKPWGGLGRTLWKRAVDADATRAVDRVSFACTLIRRAALDQVGFLDEGFEFYSEDYDLFKRLKTAGWKTLFCPQAEIVHHWGASSSQRSEWALRQLYRSKRLYFAKHHGRASETVLRIGLAGRFILQSALAAARYPVARQAASRQIALYRLLSQDMLRSLV